MDGSGIAGVDHDGFALAGPHPDVVFLECRDRAEDNRPGARRIHRGGYAVSVRLRDTKDDMQSNLSFSDFLASPPGQYVLRWELEHLDRAVADIFGYHAIQLGLPE